MKPYIRQNGFTLVEVIISMAITMVFFGIITTISLSFHQSFRRIEQAHNIQIETSRIMDVVRDTLDTYNLDVTQTLSFENGVFSFDEEDVLYFDAEETILYFRRANEATLRSVSLEWIDHVTFSVTGEVLVVEITDNRGLTTRKVYTLIGGVTP